MGGEQGRGKEGYLILGMRVGLGVGVGVHVGVWARVGVSVGVSLTHGRLGCLYCALGLGHSVILPFKSKLLSGRFFFQFLGLAQGPLPGSSSSLGPSPSVYAQSICTVYSM